MFGGKNIQFKTNYQANAAKGLWRQILCNLRKVYNYFIVHLAQSKTSPLLDMGTMSMVNGTIEISRIESN